MLSKSARVFLMIVALLSLQGSDFSQSQDPNRKETQLSSNGTMMGIHLTQDRVYDSAAFDQPTSIRWKTGRLFILRLYTVNTFQWQGVPGNPSSAERSQTSHNFTDLVVAGGTIYFTAYNDDGHVFAQDAESGKDKWRLSLKKIRFTAPSIAGNVLFAGADDGTLYALDASTGTELWRYKNKNQGVYARPPIVDSGTVYFAISEPGAERARDEGKMLAVDAQTGKVMWTFKTKGTVGTPALRDKTLYVGNSEGYLYAIDADSGQEKWKFKSGKAVYGPALMNGVVYFFDAQGTLYAVDKDSGQEKWRGSKLPKVGDHLALHDGVIFYSGAQNSVFAVDGATGQSKWVYKTDGPCRAPVVGGGKLYFFADGSIYSLDATTGTALWKFDTGSKLGSAFAVMNKTLYFLTVEGHLFSVQ